MIELEAELEFETPPSSEDREIIYQAHRDLLGERLSFIDLKQKTETRYTLVMKLKPECIL